MKPLDVAERKPKWLRKMERESWQPELIISGAAILGSLQLPSIITTFEHYALLNFDRDTILLGYIAAIYWHLLATGLIFTFIFHFIVRALWIGLIGLNSVYSGGFRPNDKFSEHYQERMREEYGDIDGFIQRLDRLGSGIFGFAFGIAGTFMNFGLIALGFVFVHSWLMGHGFDPRQTLMILGLLLVPILLLSTANIFANLKSVRDTRVVRRWQWPVAKFISRFTYPVARRYIITSTNLVTSYYVDGKGFILYFIGGILAIIVMGSATIRTSDNIPFFIDSVYHGMADDSTRLADVYADDAAYEGIFYQPVLVEAAGKQDSLLRVWIPLPEREVREMEKACRIPEVGDEVPDRDRRSLRRRRILRCAEDYLSFALNGQTLPSPVLKRQYRVNVAGEQFGVAATFTGVPLRAGDNLLLVSTAYLHEHTGEPRRSYLPFFLRP